MKKGNIITSVLCILLAAYVIITCMGYPKAEAYGTGVPGPGLWPGVIACGLLLVSVGLLITALRAKKEELAELPMLSEGSKRVYITMAFLVIYVACLGTVGFIIPSVLLLFGLIQWFGKYKPVISALVAIGATLVVYFVFKSLLNVPVDFGMFYF